MGVYGYWPRAGEHPRGGLPQGTSDCGWKFGCESLNFGFYGWPASTFDCAAKEEGDLFRQSTVGACEHCLHAVPVSTAGNNDQDAALGCGMFAQEVTGNGKDGGVVRQDWPLESAMHQAAGVRLWVRVTADRWCARHERAPGRDCVAGVLGATDDPDRRRPRYTAAAPSLVPDARVIGRPTIDASVPDPCVGGLVNTGRAVDDGGGPTSPTLDDVGCATQGCTNQPAWPSVRRSLTWCDDCLRCLCFERGYVPLEPLTDPKARWLVSHVACGKERYTNLRTIRTTEPVCPHCRWSAWGATVRAGLWQNWQRHIITAWATGSTGELTELLHNYMARYVWSAERIRALFDTADAELLTEPEDGDGLDPLPWRCRRCGWIDALPAERMLGEARASWLVCRSCNQDRLHRDPAPLARYYQVRRLRLLATVAKDRAEAYNAECMRCGTLRRVSVGTLASGAPPCLVCDGRRLDPAAPHHVYLFEFPHLQAYKVGITHTADDSRLAKHRAAGGSLCEVVEVPNRATALLLERLILDQYRDHPAEVAEHHFPQGGWTECWDSRVGRPSLADVYAVVRTRDGAGAAA